MPWHTVGEVWNISYWPFLCILLVSVSGSRHWEGRTNPPCWTRLGRGGTWEATPEESAGLCLVPSSACSFPCAHRSRPPVPSAVTPLLPYSKSPLNQKEQARRLFQRAAHTALGSTAALPTRSVLQQIQKVKKEEGLLAPPLPPLAPHSCSEV